MQQIEKGECKNLSFANLDSDGYLTFLLIHPLIGQSAELNFVGGVVRVDGYTDASRDGKGATVDIHGLA